MPVMQFKIVLSGTKPFIWRQIQISDRATLWDLHCAIQDSMGWEDSHLHHFEVVVKGRLEWRGIPHSAEFHDEMETFNDNEIRCKDVFVNEYQVPVKYLYDYGDGWSHLVKFEGIVDREEGCKYPVCIAGERACPPEDCGGIDGYNHYVKVMAQKKGSEYKEFLDWRGEYHPDEFSPESVEFTNSKKRYKELGKIDCSCVNMGLKAADKDVRGLFFILSMVMCVADRVNGFRLADKTI